jgi:hypothetical protein
LLKIDPKHDVYQGKSRTNSYRRTK